MDGQTNYLCDDKCFGVFKAKRIVKPVGRGRLNCSQCTKEIKDKLKSLTWEGMVFCNEDCLGEFSTILILEMVQDSMDI